MPGVVKYQVEVGDDVSDLGSLAYVDSTMQEITLANGSTNVQLDFGGVSTADFFYLISDQAVSVYFANSGTEIPVTANKPLILSGTSLTAIYVTNQSGYAAHLQWRIYGDSGASTTPATSDLSTALANTSNPLLGDAMVGYKASGAGAVARTVHSRFIDFPVSVKDYGATGDGTTDDTNAIKALIAAHDYIEFTAGTYLVSDSLELSGKTVFMRPGVKIKLAGGMVKATDATGVPIIIISGANVTINGDFELDGNNANNDSSGFASDAREGLIEVTADDFALNGTVTITDSYYMGLLVDGGNDTGDEIENVDIHGIKVVNPSHYAVTVWSAKGWNIDRIEVERGSGSDARVRTGTGSTLTAQTLNGKIGTIQTDDTVVLEARTKYLRIDSVECFAIKTEDNSDVSIGSIQSNGLATSPAIDAFPFAILNADRIQVGSVLVNDNSTINQSVVINSTSGSYIGSVIVNGTVSNVTDFLIRSAENLHIDSIQLINPVGTGGGFLFDYEVAYAPQTGIVIGSLYSYGHTADDIAIQDGGDITVSWMNSNATKSGTRAASYIPYSFVYGSFNPGLTTGSGSVTIDASYNVLQYTKIANIVFVSGELRLSAVNTPGGALTLTGLPYPVTNMTGASESPTFSLACYGMAATAGEMIAYSSGTLSTITIVRVEAGAANDAGDMMTNTTRIIISGFYITN